MLLDVYPKVDEDYEIIGELNLKEKKALLNCFINSRFIKRKVKKALTLELKKL